MGGYLCFLNILDLGSPCFSEEGAKVQHLKACAQHREIYVDSPWAAGRCLHTWDCMDSPGTQHKGTGTLLWGRWGDSDPAEGKERSWPHPLEKGWLLAQGAGRCRVAREAAGWVTAGWAAGVAVRGDTCLHLAAGASSRPGSVQMIGNELWSQPPLACSFRAGESPDWQLSCTRGPEPRTCRRKREQILPLHSWVQEFGGLLEVPKGFTGHFAFHLFPKARRQPWWEGRDSAMAVPPSFRAGHTQVIWCTSSKLQGMSPLNLAQHSPTDLATRLF